MLDWLESWIENKGNWFDLLAYCYAYICNCNYNMPQFSFLFEQYLCQTNSKLTKVIDDIANIVTNDHLLLGDSFNDASNKIKHTINQNLSIPSEHDEIIRCGIVIAGIDKAFADSQIAITVSNVGPLNNQKLDSIGVYLKAGDSIIENALSVFNIKSSPESHFSERLQVFDLVEQISPYPLPQIKRLPSSLVNFRNKNSSSTSSIIKLRIGIAACSHTSVFGQIDESAIVCEHKNNTLSFQYSPSYIERYNELVGLSLQKAINSSCDIVVYPELIMSSEFIREIQKQLQATSDTQSLQLIIAGSGWEQKPTDCFGQNVCYILDKYGRIQARSTKKIPYIKEIATEKYMENLDPVAHETTLLDLDGFGRLMTSVCKDLETDTLYTPRMANAFKPDLVCVPAASGSVKGAFSNPLEFISERVHAICCIANLCSMVEHHHDKDTISYISIPGIQDRETHHSRFPHCFQEPCNREYTNDAVSCKSDTDGCLFLVDIDYDIDSNNSFLPTIKIQNSC